MNSFVKNMIFVLPILILTISYYLLNTFREFYFNYLMGHESTFPYAIGEWMQFFFYLIAAIIAIINFLILNKVQATGSNKFSLLAFTSFCFFISMEEISWGQNIFGFNTPESIKNINFQDQITFHNLNPLQNEFSLFGMPFSILHIFFITLGLILGLSFPLRNRKRVKFFIPFIPPWYLSLYYLIPAIYYLSVSFGILEVWHQELFETILSLGFALLSINNLRESLIYNK